MEARKMAENVISQNNKARPNCLGIKGWIYAGKYNLERYLYILHRVSGLAILLYFILHIWVNGKRMQGQLGWEGIMQSFETPLFKIGEFALFCAVVFHALNGLRLILGELGFFLGRPHKPAYPYDTALQKQRPLFWILMLVAFVVLVAGGVDFLLGWTK